MNLIFSVFVSRPHPPLPPATPWRSSSTPASILRPIAIATRTTYINPSPRECPYISSPLSSALISRSFSLSEFPPTSLSVRIYLPSVVRFRVIKLARAASLGFYLPEKKRINFERRHRFSAGTLFRFVYANARSGRRQELHSFGIIFFGGIGRYG